jgi:APA family basic amino acid/polyamine antiporter
MMQRLCGLEYRVMKQPLQLARRLGLFDATMIVMGGIIGSGIFINPYVVAQQVHTPALILGAWFFGGLVALAGAFIYAELAAHRPNTGGQYAYLREAFHPAVAFMYGWVLLLVVQSGGMAAVAVTFARYFNELVRISMPDWIVAILALGALTTINCLGVRAGSTAQNILMILKIAAIASLILCGLFLVEGSHVKSYSLLDRPVSFDLVTAIGAALVPVLFAYGGWHTSSFVSGELREPRRDLPRGLLLGVSGVIVLYVSVAYVCVRALGVEGLQNTRVPASAVMNLALGEAGARLIAIGIAISTLGFLSQGMLTAPRVYFAMADDGLFFKSVAYLNPRTKVPVTAIILQGAIAMIIAVSGTYEQILNYVVSMDFLWMGLTASCLFVFHRRMEENQTTKQVSYPVPGHPWTTLFFIAASWFVVANAFLKYPRDSAMGFLIALCGIPIYFFWHRSKQNHD